MAPPIVAALVGLLMWWFLGAFAVQFVLVFLFFYLMAGVGIPFLTHTLSQRTAQRLVQIRSDLNTVLVDGIQGLADLMAFGHEAAYAERIQKLNRSLVHEQTRLAWLGGMQNGLGKLFTNLALWTMLVVAIPLVHIGQLNGIYLASLALATVASFEAVLPLSSALQQFGSCQEAGRRLFEIIDAPASVHDTTAVSPTPQGYDLTVQHLYFRYTSDTPLTHIPQFRERKNRFGNKQSQVNGGFSDEGVEVPKPACVLGIRYECATDQCPQNTGKSSAWWDDQWACSLD